MDALSIMSKSYYRVSFLSNSQLFGIRLFSFMGSVTDLKGGKKKFAIWIIICIFAGGTRRGWKRATTANEWQYHSGVMY